MIVKVWRKLPEKNAFEDKKKKPGLKFNLRLALIGLRTTGPRVHRTGIHEFFLLEMGGWKIKGVHKQGF